MTCLIQGGGRGGGVVRKKDEKERLERMLKVQEQEATESCLRLQIKNVNAKKQQKSLKMWWLFENFENFLESYG